MSPRAAARLEAMGFADVYDYVAGKSDWAASGLELEGALAEVPTARDAADRETPTCRLDEPLADVQERAATVGWSACVVVDERGVVLGLLGGAALSGSAGETVEDAMTEGPSTVRPNVPLEELTRRMKERGLEHVVVTTSNGRLVGVVRRERGV